MSIEIIPFQFQLNSAVIAGICLWALALYLGCSSFREWVIESLNKLPTTRYNIEHNT